MSTLIKEATLTNIDAGSYSDWYKMKVEIWLDSQSIENKTSTITIKRFYATQKASAGWYKFTSPKLRNYLSINNGSWTDLGYTAIKELPQNQAGVWKQFGSWSGTINHKDDGTQVINVRTTFRHDTSLSSYPYMSKNADLDTGNFNLPTIARASVPTLSNSSFNIGDSITINTNRFSSSFTHTIRIAFGSWSKTLATGVTNSATWSTSSDASSLYAQVPSANSGTGTIYVDTYSGSTLIGTKSIGFTAKVTNSNPTFNSSQVTYQDTNSTVVAITGNNQHIVRNKSTLRVVFTNATAKNSATISRYEITFNGSTQTKTTGSTIDYGVINLGSNTSVSVKVIDSRGNATTVTKTITILDWVNPTAIIKAGRVNNYENTTKIKAQVTISSVNSKNAITELKYRYKKTNTSTWGSYVSFSNNVETSVNIDKNYAWNFQVYIVDKFGNTTYNFTVAKGMPIMFFDINKISVGVNKFPINNNSLDVDIINGKSILNLTYPVGSIYMSVNSTNPGTLFGGTWVQLQNRFLLGAGSSYSNGATGGSATVTLNVNQIPAHTHTQASCTDPGNHSHYIPNARSTSSSGSPPKFESWPTCTSTSRNHYTDGAGSHTHTITLNNTGGGQAHDNMPPYLVVYMWKRTA